MWYSQYLKKSLTIIIVNGLKYLQRLAFGKCPVTCYPLCTSDPPQSPCIQQVPHPESPIPAIMLFISVLLSLLLC